LDPGAEEVLVEIREAVARYGNVFAVGSLGPAYPLALSVADVVVGNSSSGVIEAASFRLPAVDVGDRQAGRLRPMNVINVPDDSASIADGLDRALAPAFRTSLESLVNPYGDGRAAPRIVDAVVSAPLERLARKRFVDLDCA
jgi:UDP-N-acetylglucosamine 2-epimerase